ncbi:hypothetical protein A3D14_02140 [Candidatus Saccharibacteria bacterium RIFCSPHIGHO2_02_FULL_47_12]|nr:MAG: hypothetical protein A3D14_02140 [Candidatus Saccharibacteria bacterium RIFCSPHIGHO2_02_FULL_47_12]
MKINVGSTNPTKVSAVRNIAAKHGLFKDVEVVGVEVEVEEFGHPKSLQETIVGAQQRAEKAFVNCSYSVGLESGLFVAAGTKSGYFETTACSIFDGKNHHIGLGPSFEWPTSMVKMILGGLDGSQAFKKLGLTNHDKIGVAEGGIYVLTKGKINRVKLNELAFTMALLQLENPEHY